MAMTPALYSISGLATEFRMDRRTVAKRLADLRPAEVRGRTRLYRLSDAAQALVRPAGRHNGSRKPPGQLLDEIAIPLEFLVPWVHDEVMTLREYEESLGFKKCDGEILDWIVYGFPILPPAPGEEVARVSRPHAELWRLLFGGCIQMLGGDGMALRLGEEARRIRGLPLIDDLDEGVGDDGC